jgi:hypothetical protein
MGHCKAQSKGPGKRLTDKHHLLFTKKFALNQLKERRVSQRAIARIFDCEGAILWGNNGEQWLEKIARAVEAWEENQAGVTREILNGDLPAWRVLRMNLMEIVQICAQLCGSS